LKECSDLAGFRDAAALSRLPEPERKQWQSLWAEIDALDGIYGAMTRHDLGNEVQSQSLLDKAIAGFRSAIRLAPDHADSHCRLGNALIRKDKLDEASAAFREAIRLKPDDAEGHYGLGNALKGQGRLDDAIAEYREAIRLKPDHAEAHCNLGSALKGQGKLDEASAGYREAIRLKPDYAEAHSNLGGILNSRGDGAGALAMYRKWREINQFAPGLHPSAEIRSRTLDWLKAERDAWSKQMDGGDANARASLVETLRHWKVDTKMAGVRDPEALAKLPEPERKEWQSLWADVEALLERAEGHAARTVDAAGAMPAEAPAPDPNPTAAAVNPLYAPQDLAQSYINQGLTSKAVPLLLTASAADPNDTLLSLKVAALQAWFGQEKELAATRQRILTFAEGTKNSSPAELERVLALGRAGKDLEGEAQGPWSWCLLALGMAEYRSGNDAAADEALLAAAEADPNNPFSTGTSAFYRAMSIFRQGKTDEARKLAIEFAAKMNPLPADEQNPLTGGANFDHLILWLAYKEAKASIKFDAAPAGPAAPERK